MIITNDFRIEIIDLMSEELKDPLGSNTLCCMYEYVYITIHRKHKADYGYLKMTEMFPAIVFFARICGAYTTNFNKYWWKTNSAKPRIKTLKMLRNWYKFKYKLGLN